MTPDDAKLEEIWPHGDEWSEWPGKKTKQRILEYGRAVRDATRRECAEEAVKQLLEIIDRREPHSGAWNEVRRLVVEWSRRSLATESAGSSAAINLKDGTLGK